MLNSEISIPKELIVSIKTSSTQKTSFKGLEKTTLISIERSSSLVFIVDEETEHSLCRADAISLTAF